MEKGIDYPGVSIVFYCHDGIGNVVMAKRTENCRDEHHKWDIGGGGLEQGDTVEGTLRKEIMEEYCLDVIDMEFLGYRDVHRQNGDGMSHWITLDYKVLIDPLQVRNGEPHKFEEVRLFSRDQLPSEVHSQLPKFLNKYRSRLT